MIQKFHVMSCPGCEADLTKEMAVRVHFSCSQLEFDTVSSLDPNGLLLDEDKFIRNGYHAGSYCHTCDGFLEELEHFSWRDLSRILGGPVANKILDQDITICDPSGKFFHCLGFERTADDHWFLRMEAVEVQESLQDDLDRIDEIMGVVTKQLVTQLVTRLRAFANGDWSDVIGSADIRIPNAADYALLKMAANLLAKTIDPSLTEDEPSTDVQLPCLYPGGICTCLGGVVSHPESLTEKVE